MSYTVIYHSDQRYSLESKISVDKCDSCGLEEQQVQELPAECNVAEVFIAYLCKPCLLKLAKEL